MIKDKIKETNERQRQKQRDREESKESMVKWDAAFASEIRAGKKISFINKRYRVPGTVLCNPKFEKTF